MAAGTTDDLFDSVYRVQARMRWGLLAHALVVNLTRVGRAEHPQVLLAVCLAMTLWTAVVNRLLEDLRTRRSAVFWSDLAVSALVVAMTDWTLGHQLFLQTHLALGGFWMVMPCLALAVWYSAGVGMASAGALVLLSYLHSLHEPWVWSLLVVEVLSAWATAQIVTTVQEVAADRDARNVRLLALAERDRLNRIVHDGALQVLAMVEREGPELGPKGERLAVLARRQEAQLRLLLQDRTVDLPGEPGSQTDVVQLLEAHADDRVTVAAPAGEVLLQARRARELDAAVSEALLNVERHAGPGARAWILVEVDDGELLVSIRDDGVGMSREQVADAAAGGRLGIGASILGRMEDIGGRAVARSQPGRGVEWELHVPMDSAEEE